MLNKISDKQMNPLDTAELKELLASAARGDSSAYERLFAAYYDELHKQARYLSRNDGTMRATALVGEFYLKLNKSGELTVTDRKHFRNLAARMMRQILADYYRTSGNRARQSEQVALEEYHQLLPAGTFDYFDLERALEKLAENSPRHAQVVDLHIFGGFTFSEVAETLEITEDRACLDYRQARVALHRLLMAPAEQVN